jgi:hypothetical protein
MIKEWYVQRSGEQVLFGFAIESAVMDILTDEDILKKCLEALEVRLKWIVDMKIGTFGEFTVRLNLHVDDSVSLFIDGPQFTPSREQCSAIWLNRTELRDILEKILYDKEDLQRPRI